MAKIKVTNPAGRTKAVRCKGGFEVLKRGESAVVDQNWTEDEKKRYEVAGLKIGKAAKEDGSAETENAAPPAPKLPNA